MSTPDPPRPTDVADHTCDTVALDEHGKPKKTHLPTGASIGRYVVQELLGEGGMGAVYKAFDGELSRAVALKVINADVGQGGTRASGKERLLREAQALARLAHPNVLPVYDVGTFGDGVFIATEFVAGRTLRAWLKDGAHSTAEIVSVFLAAGHGLAAAHRADLIHRDFKPDNVMVGDDGRIRVLDFGLARAARRDDGSEPEAPLAEPPLAEPPSTPVTQPPPASPLEPSPDLTATPTSGQLLSSPLTAHGAIMGTPRYMAPEQHRGEEVDPRADQFAFGVALYEALYGRMPFAASSLPELKRRVLAGKVVPPPRDAKVPARLWRLVSRALAVSPERRFPSMDALLVELGRDPARRRRRWLAGTLAAAAVAATVLGWISAERRQRLICRGAEQQLAGVWDVPKRTKVHDSFVGTKLPYAEAAFTQIARIFDDYARSWVAMHTDACEATQLRGEQSQELLDLRMECLSDRLSSFAAQVDVLAVADATVVERADHAARALPPLADCADAALLRAPVRPPADPTTRARVAEVRKQLGRARALEAAGRYRDGLPVARAAVTAATALHYRPVEADALLALGTLENGNGAPKDAVATLRAATLAADAGRADELRVEALVILVEVAGEELSRYADAHAFGTEAAAILLRLDQRDALMASLERNQGIVWWREGKYEPAKAALSKALELRIKVFGAEDRRVAETLSDYADVLADEGKLDPAMEQYQRALAVWVKSLGPEHPQVAVTINNMANVLATEGKLDEALAQFRHAQAIWERSLGPQHPKVGAVLNNIGDTYARLGRYKDALDCYRRALPMLEAAMGPTHFTVGVAQVSIGEAEQALGRVDAALASYHRGLAVLEQALGPTHPQLSIPLCDLGDALRARGDSAGALGAYRRAEALLEKSPDSPERARALVGVGLVYLSQHEVERAIESLQRALTLREGHPGDPLALAEARFALAQALWQQGRDRQRAGALATATRTIYEKAGPRGQEGLAALDQWLDHHR
jgi:eukaryotic-like serine/threonine-protein kinase